MAGGTASGGYDLPGIAWTVLFATGGVAIHSTFWHNNFGVPMSHGCVNAAPEILNGFFDGQHQLLVMIWRYHCNHAWWYSCFCY
jgi:hypothetical protein